MSSNFLFEAAYIYGLNRDAQHPLPRLYAEHPKLSRVWADLGIFTLLSALVGPIIFFKTWEAILIGLFVASFYCIPMLLIANLLVRPGFVIGLWLNIGWIFVAWYLVIRGFHYVMTEIYTGTIPW